MRTPKCGNCQSSDVETTYENNGRENIPFWHCLSCGSTANAYSIHEKGWCRPAIDVATLQFLRELQSFLITGGEALTLVNSFLKTRSLPKEGKCWSCGKETWIGEQDEERSRTCIECKRKFWKEMI
jgi:DNA-directed RNA polymerase subunit RPC12/RpoP